MADNLSIIFSLIGTAVGGLIGYNTAIKVSDRKEMQKAAIDFHDAFLDALISLDHRYYCTEITEENGIGSVYRTLSKTFPGQIKAMMRFRLYLCTDKREAFDTAWKEYCSHNGNDAPEHPFLEKYFGNTWEGQSTRELAVKNIYKLLSFVEELHKSPLS